MQMHAFSLPVSEAKNCQFKYAVTCLLLKARAQYEQSQLEDHTLSCCFSTEDRIPWYHKVTSICPSTANSCLSIENGSGCVGFFSFLPVPHWTSVTPSIQLKVPTSTMQCFSLWLELALLKCMTKSDIRQMLLLLKDSGTWYLMAETVVPKCSRPAGLHAEVKVSSPSHTFKFRGATVNIMEDSKNTDKVNICACIINHFLFYVTSNKWIHNGLSLIQFLSEIPEILPSSQNIPAVLSYCIL